MQLAEMSTKPSYEDLMPKVEPKETRESHILLVHIPAGLFGLIFIRSTSCSSFSAISCLLHSFHKLQINFSIDTSFFF